MIEQITVTINKQTARILARFLSDHCYEWRHCYDDQKGIRNSYFATVPSVESRQVWLELVNTLEEKQVTSIPVTY
jgi:hypothetical protein